jgi:hypothetical protein
MNVQVPDRSGPGDFPEGYLAICVIVKNQHRDIREWLEYHRWLGVQKVYLYDNNSSVSGSHCSGCCKYAGPGLIDWGQACSMYGYPAINPDIVSLVLAVHAQQCLRTSSVPMTACLQPALLLPQ